ALIKSRLDALSNGGNGSFAKQIGEHLKKIEIGQPVHSHSLSLFPLLGSWEEKSRYVLLEEGLAAGTVAVTETSEAGQVPYLLLRNDGDLPVLLPEGAILKGEKQNRVINTTILVAAKSVFTVPVSCVEQGRWHRSRHGFQADSHAPSSLRSKKMRAVQESRAFRGTAESNQSEVWREVAFAMDSLNVRSNTGSMSDAYERRRVDLDVLRRNLTPPPQALGVVMCRNNRIVGMDLFDSSQTFSKVWPRLADGYLIEALNDAPCDQAVNASSVESFLSDIPQFSRRADPTLGIGTEFNIQGNQMVGTGVLYEEAVCHLCAFAGSASGL
ncbi:MAG TPA: hypothetical protein PKH07_08595, partial [bacterium]|nr:hypothetical protein [bacterium]